MIDTRLLKAAIAKKGLTQAEVAKKMGISSQSLNGKLHNKTEFQLSEVMVLCKMLDIGVEKDRIFFAQSLDLKSNIRG